MVRGPIKKLNRQLHPVGFYIPQTILGLHRNKGHRGRPLESQASTFRAVKTIHKQLQTNQGQNIASKRGRGSGNIKERRLVLIQIQGGNGSASTHLVGRHPTPSLLLRNPQRGGRSIKGTVQRK